MHLLLHLGGEFKTQFILDTPSVTLKCKLSPFAYISKNYMFYKRICEGANTCPNMFSFVCLQGGIWFGTKNLRKISKVLSVWAHLTVWCASDTPLCIVRCSGLASAFSASASCPLCTRHYTVQSIVCP
jgi:hypothetical protein